MRKKKSQEALRRTLSSLDAESHDIINDLGQLDCAKRTTAQIKSTSVSTKASALRRCNSAPVAQGDTSRTNACGQLSSETLKCDSLEGCAGSLDGQSTASTKISDDARLLDTVSGGSDIPDCCVSSLDGPSPLPGTGYNEVDSVASNSEGSEVEGNGSLIVNADCSTPARKRERGVKVVQEVQDEEGSQASALLKSSKRKRMIVAVRVRPFSKRELTEGRTQRSLAFVPNRPLLELLTNEGDPDAWKGKTFKYDHVFNSTQVQDTQEFATQSTIFNNIGRPLVDAALDGYNICIFAYGQTGAGKTHSILGDTKTPEEYGLLPRTCAHLFSALTDWQRSQADSHASVSAQFLEIYNEKVRDLLVHGRKELRVRMEPKGGCVVDDLTDNPIECFQDALKLLDRGQKHRITAATDMNEDSSRSHAVFTLDVKLHSHRGDFQSKLHLVDLAGSEKIKKANRALNNQEGDQRQSTIKELKQGIAINQSLSTLSRTILTLSSNDRRAVPPFRDSKLTMLLREALSGNSRTSLLACVSPSRWNVDETISTLDFAARCKSLKNRVSMNELKEEAPTDKEAVIQRLFEEKISLEEQLRVAREDAFQYREAAKQNERLIADFRAISAAKGRNNPNASTPALQNILLTFDAKGTTISEVTVPPAGSGRPSLCNVSDKPTPFPLLEVASVPDQTRSNHVIAEADVEDLRRQLASCEAQLSRSEIEAEKLREELARVRGQPFQNYQKPPATTTCCRRRRNSAASCTDHV